MKMNFVVYTKFDLVVVETFLIEILECFVLTLYVFMIAQVIQTVRIVRTNVVNIQKWKYLTSSCQTFPVLNVKRCIVKVKFFLMGLPWFRQGEIIETATQQAMTVNQAKIVNANADTFDFSAMSFTGNSVTGASKVALAA